MFSAGYILKATQALYALIFSFFHPLHILLVHYDYPSLYFPIFEVSWLFMVPQYASVNPWGPLSTATCSSSVAGLFSTKDFFPSPAVF